MINQEFKDMIQAPSVIRALAGYANQRGKEIGYENVFDYSLGNPSVPVPEKLTETMIELLQTKDSSFLHGYSPNPGNPVSREVTADFLNRKFGMDYTMEHIFMTSGAAGAVAHALRCVTKPGDEVLTFAPFFPEYNPYVNKTGAILKVVPADTTSFQINFDAFEEMLNPKVNAVLINTPKQKEYGHDIFIISDEPYGEIVFAGVDAPYVSKFYDNSISCYSYSKSMSIPGERLGYVAVNPRATDAKLIVPMCCQISRGTGHNCPASLIQIAVAKCIDLTSDLSVYETNMNILYKELVDLGFEVVKPGGTFYIFPKALEEDANAFSEKAKKYDLILVPSDSFGVKGYFRMAYCIDTEKVERSLDALRRFVKTEYGK